MLCTIKAYGKDLYKVTYHKAGKRAKKESWVEEITPGNEGGSGGKEGEKELCNLFRAKSAVRELALCNEWEFFVTLTLDKNKQNRYSLDGYIKDLGVWIGNYNRRFGTKLRYLLIPEQHKDGAWHMHGLFQGVAPDSLVKNVFGYWDMPYYYNRFGYISLSELRDGKKTASYITKYVAKAFGHTDVELCKHSYYCSKGLQRAYTIDELNVAEISPRAWQNDYCGIEWINGDIELMEFLGRTGETNKE